MHRDIVILLALAVVLGGAPASVAAQFQVPLTPPIRGDTVCAIKADNDDACNAQWDTVNVRALRGSLRALERRTDEQGRIRIRDRLFRVEPQENEQLKFTRWSISGVSLFHSDRELRDLYRGSGIQWFDQFQATLTDERIYVASSLLSGLIGRVRFDLSVANAVSSEEEAGPDLTEDQVREGTTNLMRLINNGGSGAARLLTPFRAGGGTNHQIATGAYLNLGAIGPLSDVDSLAFTGGAVAEGLFTWSIRNATSYELEGEIITGLRLGYQWVGDGFYINPTTDDQHLPFVQAAVGIREEGETHLLLLYTWVQKRYREFTPQLQLSVNTSGF